MPKDYYLDWRILALDQEIRNLELCLSPEELKQLKLKLRKNVKTKK